MAVLRLKNPFYDARSHKTYFATVKKRHLPPQMTILNAVTPILMHLFIC